MPESTSSWFSYLDLGTIAGLIGATAWLAPWIYQKFTKPTIEGRLISKFENEGQFNNSKCLMHFLALNLISLNKSFNIRETKILIKYKDSPDTYSGTLFWARVNEWTGPHDERLCLNISPEEALPFMGTLPKNITKKVYLTFRVDKAKLEEFEEIKLTFVEHSNCERELVIKHAEIVPDQILWDDRIWKEVSPNK